MTELDPRARELIGLAREDEGPSEGERSRLRAAVATRLGVVLASAGATGTAGTASAAPSVIGTSAGAVISKIVVAGALLCGVGAGGYAALTSSAPASRPQEKTPAAMERVAPAIASVPSPQTNVSAARSPAAPPPPAPPPAAPPKTVPSGITVSPIEAETRALGLALTDLRNGNAERALSALDAQLTRFPDGALAEERAEARIMALCSLGRTEEARDNAARFFVEHPRSVLAGRVRASCGGRDLSGH